MFIFVVVVFTNKNWNKIYKIDTNVTMYGVDLFTKYENMQIRLENCKLLPYSIKTFHSKIIISIPNKYSSEVEQSHYEFQSIREIGFKNKVLRKA